MIPGIVAQASSGASGTPTERWWRVNFINTNSGGSTGSSGDAYIDIYQVQVFTEIGGPEKLATAVAFDACPPNIPNASLAIYNGSIKWNNWGIRELNQGCYIAFKLDTALEVQRVAVRSGGGYGQFDVLIESSWDGIDWEFEYGYARTPGGGLINYDRQNIDWDTFTCRDWLVQPHKIFNYTNLGILEIEMAETIGGPDMCSGGTPRSTGNGTYPASNLTDNNIGTLCGSLGTGRLAYIGYTFPIALNIQEMRIYPHPNERPDWYSLCAGLGTPGTFSGPWYIKQVCLGIEKGGSGAAWSNFDARNPRRPSSPSGPHRYWRLRPLRENHHTSTAYSFAKIDFRKLGASLAGSGTAIAANWYDANWVPANAFDNDPNTGWHSDVVTMKTWIGYDFGVPVNPDELIITSRNYSGSDGYNQQPKHVAIEFSDDGMNWFPRKSVAMAPANGPLVGYTIPL